MSLQPGGSIDTMHTFPRRSYVPARGFAYQPAARVLLGDVPVRGRQTVENLLGEDVGRDRVLEKQYLRLHFAIADHAERSTRYHDPAIRENFM